MDITLNQEYEITNLISYPGHFTPTEYQKNLVEMMNIYKDYALKSDGYIITVTKSIEFVNGKQVMDVEILFPVNSCISVKEPYKFKEKIRLTNALYVNVTDIARLQEALEQVDRYIKENNLQPITSAYLIQTKQDNTVCNEIYVGINPNIL